MPRLRSQRKPFTASRADIILKRIFRAQKSFGAGKKALGPITR